MGAGETISGEGDQGVKSRGAQGNGDGGYDGILGEGDGV